MRGRLLRTMVRLRVGDRQLHVLVARAEGGRLPCDRDTGGSPDPIHLGPHQLHRPG